MQRTKKRVSQKPTGAQARTRAQQSHGKRKRQIRNRRLALLFLLCVVVLGALSVTVLFPIKAVEIKGNTHYEEGELLAVAGIEKNHNMFTTNMGSAAKRLKDTYPYIEEAHIKRNFSGTVTITVEEAKETGAVAVDKKNVIVSGKNRILKIGQAKKPDGIYLLKGVTIREPVAGAYLEIIDRETNDAIIALFELLNKYPLGKISLIDVSNRSKLVVEVDNTKRVIFGDSSDLEYKARMVKEIIDNKLNANESVVIDATTPSKVRMSPKQS